MNFLFCLSSWVVGLAVVFSLTFSQHAFGAAGAFNPDPGSATIPASVSGVVYFDANHNGTLDTGEYAIGGGTVQLYSGTTLKATAQVSSTGQYSFSDLDPGTYSLYNTTNGTWTAVPGYIRTMANTVHNSTATGNNMQISDVALAAGDTGELFDFGAQYYPIQLLSKRMLLASTPTSDTPVVQAVPEPATLLMLSCAAIPFVITATMRRFRRN